MTYPNKGLIKRVIAGMFVALDKHTRMLIKHSEDGWKINFDKPWLGAYVNLYNIARTY